MPTPRTFMFVAGETSGDLLAAELIQALRAEALHEPPSAGALSAVPAGERVVPSRRAGPGLRRAEAATAAQAGEVEQPGVHGTNSRANLQVAASHETLVFFGAGGANMARAGAQLAFDLTQHAVIGIWDVLPNLIKFRRLMNELVELALERRPDVIVCVDFSGFNRRLGHAVRQRQAEFPGWKPALVQFVSPQVWASRPGRAAKMAQDFDLLLSIFPFEKGWYAKHVPAMRVEFVGHPMLDRHNAALGTPPSASPTPASRTILLLPGSRVGELRRHLPVMTAAAQTIRKSHGTGFHLVVPNESLLPLARELTAGLEGLQIQVGHLATALPECTLALASTGTVTMECAYFGVPTITLYRTNWFTYEIARRVVTVSSLTMPNLLAGETVYPEFIQHDATAANLAAAARALLDSPERRTQMKAKLATIIQSLGEPGACRRAAAAILSLHPPVNAPGQSP